MKHFKNSATYLVLVYAIALGLAALLNSYYPSQAASFVHYFLPMDTELSGQPFIRYRMVLWLIATMVFLTLVPIIGYFGTPEMNVEKLKRVHWINIPIVLVMYPVIWIFYPIIALCTTCWTSNDAFYFALTIAIFLGFNISVYAATVRLKLILKGQ